VAFGDGVEAPDKSNDELPSSYKPRQSAVAFEEDETEVTRNDDDVEVTPEQE
jgi:hypothetical protein